MLVLEQLAIDHSVQRLIGHRSFYPWIILAIDHSGHGLAINHSGHGLAINHSVHGLIGHGSFWPSIFLVMD